MPMLLLKLSGDTFAPPPPAPPTHPPAGRPPAHLLVRHLPTQPPPAAMGALLTVVLQTLRELVSSFLHVVRTLTQPQKCCQCPCPDYTDEALFLDLKHKSYLKTYANDVIDMGIVGRPITCQGCACPRESHGELSRRILTADALPNGGAVQVELEDRRERLRRAARFAPTDGDGDGGGGGDGGGDGGGSGNDDAPAPTADGADYLRVEDSAVGDGRSVASGDEVLLRYDAYVRRTMKRFDGVDKGGNGMQVTVGSGTLVPGFDRGLVGMRVGGKRRLWVPSRMAYGSEPIEGEREVDIVFDVEVLAVLSTH